MSLLSYNRLCELVEQGVITNVRHEQINAGSIDLTLGRTILIEEGIAKKARIVDFSKRESLEFMEYDIVRYGAYVLGPGEFVLAQTEQMFYLPNNICAEYKLKSSMARVGLEHLNAGWADAGWHGSVLTLELKNMTQHHAHKLVAGMPIGQIVFFECEPVPEDRSYASRGRYNNDSTVKGIKD